MKKLIVIAVVVIALAGIFSSCSKDICPAYASNNQPEQVEINN